MSRVTKYLRQKCSFTAATRDSNEAVVLNEFGEVLYQAAVQIPCRKEHSTEDVQTSTGSIVRSTTRYFTDTRNSIAPDDKLDNHVVLAVRDYINAQGDVEGYRSYV